MRKGLIYVRVSTIEQNYERQIEELKRFAENRNIPIEKIFKEKISASRTKETDRKQFSLMKDYAFHNNITDLFFIELSRISRKNRETINFIEDCSEKGICIHIKKEGLKTLNDDGSKNAIVSIMLSVLSSMAESEVEQLSSRIKSGKLFNAKQGKGLTTKAFGYTKDLEGFTIVDEEHRNTVELIFKLISEGNGSRTAADYLNGNKIGGKVWTGATIHTIIRNSIHKGERKYKDLIIDVPPIVTKELWSKANFEIDSKKKFAGNKNVNINVVQGYIKCKFCHSTMHQIVNPTARTNVYRCNTKNCKAKSVNRNWLYDEIRKLVEKYSSLKDDKKTREKFLQKIELNKGVIKTNEEILSRNKLRIKKVGVLYLDELIDNVEYKEMKEDILNTTSLAQYKIDELQKENTSIEKSLTGIITYFSSDNPIFKEQLKEVLEYIKVDNHFVEIKVIGFAKYLVTIPTGNELFQINRKKKGLKPSPIKLDFYDNFKESDLELYEQEYSMDLDDLYRINK